ncbi:MAG: nascent polypeptide-associated complex protein [Nanoarchaeota archaeon]
MFPNIDPKKMQAMMKQMGVSQENIDASRVVIEKTDGGKLIIENPSIQKIKIQGQESFQISGSVSEEAESFSEEDIQTIVEKTGVSKEVARETLEKTGDLAEAILELS